MVYGSSKMLLGSIVFFPFCFWIKIWRANHLSCQHKLLPSVAKLKSVVPVLKDSETWLLRSLPLAAILFTEESVSLQPVQNAVLPEKDTIYPYICSWFILRSFSFVFKGLHVLAPGYLWELLILYLTSRPVRSADPFLPLTVESFTKNS